MPKEEEVRTLIGAAREVFLREGNTLRISAPVSVAGDIHAQYSDLLELFRVGGQVPDTKYLFLGDFVDRGFDGVLTTCLLLVLKVQHRERMYLIRGNHEARQITQTYGFYDETMRTYGSPSVWRLFMDLFDYLPIAAVVEDRIFAVHGGLSPQLSDLVEIDYIERKQEVPNQGVFCDLLWSDPDEAVMNWSTSPRGAGFLFGPDVVRAFTHTNKIEIIVRAHQLVMEGFKYMFDESLVTVWSAPNYCYRCGNVASVLVINEDLSREFKIFKEANDRPLPVKKTVPEYFL